MGFIESDKVLTVTFNLFTCIWSKISALVQSINYQFFAVLLPLQLKSQTPQTNSHFTPYLSICAPGDLTINNLAHTAHLIDCQRPTLVVITKNCLLVYSSSWVEGLVSSGCCTSLYVTLSILHVSYAFHGSAKQTLFPTVGYSLGFRLNDLCSNPCRISLKGFLKRLLQWNLWRMASNRQQQRSSSRFTWLKIVPIKFDYKMEDHFGVWSTAGLEAVL